MVKDQFDEIFSQIGNFGKYQIYLYLALACGTTFPAALAAVGAVFLQGETEFTCDVNYPESELPTDYNSKCKTYTIDSCHEYENSKDNTTERVSCKNGYDFDNSTRNWYTAEVEFELVCDDKLKNTLIGSMFFFGYLIGAAMGGYISDNWGRKITIMTGLVGSFACSIGVAYSTNWWMFMLFRVLVGWFTNQSYVGAYVYCMEAIGPEWRSACGIWMSGTFAIGYGLLSPMAYIFPDWRDLQLSLAFFSVPLFFAMFFIKDSPRFLIAKNRPQEAEDWLKEIGRKNGKSEEEIKNVKIDDDLIKQVNGDGGVDEQSYSMADLFNRGRVMTMITLNCIFLWFVCSLTYYGFSLNAAALPTSLYVSNAFYAASELPAYALASWMVEKPQFGRKNTMSGCLLIGGALSYLSTVFSELSICEKDAENPFENGFVVAGFVVSILGKAAISMSFSIVYNVTAELFQKQVRANDVGL